MPLINFCLAFLASWAITGLVYCWAARLRLIDHPSQRSSHTAPTPRGGGLGLGLVWLGGLAYALLGTHAANLLSTPLLPPQHLALSGLLLGSLIIMGLGFIDDRHPLSARLRLGVQSLVALACVATLNLALGQGIPSLPWAFACMALQGVVLVWAINAANFVDGLDGFLASQCLVAVLALLALALLPFHLPLPLHAQAWGIPLVGHSGALLAACLLGFLIWNWPQAKLFMGDVGSTTLGFILAYWALWQQQSQPNSLWIYALLFGIVVVDTTLTLLVRAARGQSLWQAHRSHAYQHAAQHYRSHAVVTVAAVFIQGFWLVPWAFAVAVGLVPGHWAVGLAYAPLVLIAVYHRAGMPTDKPQHSDPNPTSGF
jgi:Fuc2NAc and GlcNAc transferase